VTVEDENTAAAVKSIATIAGLVPEKETTKAAASTADKLWRLMKAMNKSNL